MVKKTFKTPDEFVAALGDEDRRGIQALRQAVRRAVPKAEEVISYSIPAFKLNGWIFYLSAHKDHFTLSCPPPFSVFEAFKNELAAYAKTKTAVKFPKNRPLPIKLIENMATWRARENAEQAEKPAKPKGRKTK